MSFIQHKIYQPLLVAIICFLLAAYYGNYVNQANKPENIAKQIENTLIAKDLKLHAYLADIKLSLETSSDFMNLQEVLPDGLYKNEGIVFYIYSHDSLCYWSENAVPFEKAKVKYYKKHAILNLQNGWYKISSINFKNYEIIALTLIKNEYSYQNDYLQNNFHPDLYTASQINISLKPSKYNIKDAGSNFLFSIKSEAYNLPINDFAVYILVFLYLTAFIFLVTFIYRLYEALPFINNYPLIKFILFALDVFILRILVFFFHIPAILYDSRLFSPYYYASASYLPSLGDLFINAIVLLYVAYLFFIKINPKTVFTRLMPWQNRISCTLVLLSAIVLYYFYVVLFKSIIIDSSIVLNLNNIFGFTFESILACFSIFAISLSFLFFTMRLFSMAYYQLKSIKFLGLIFLTAILVFILLPLPAFLREGIFYPFAFICLIIILFVFERYTHKIKTFQQLILLLFFFSLFSTFSFYKYNEIKEKGKRKLLVQKLTAENDPIAEFLFKDIMPKIKADTNINRQLKLFYPKDSIINYLKTTYFKGYLSKYSEQMTICKDFEKLIINPDYINVNCDNYFYDKITAIGKPTTTENFYTLDYGNGSNSYIALFRFFEDLNDSLLRTSLYIELDAKFIAKDLGYPELLIDKNMNVSPDLSNYSFASYTNGLLVKHFGKYLYENILQTHDKSEEFSFEDKEAYNHLHYHVNKKTDFIISTPNVSLIERFAPFSFVFIFLGLATILFFFITGNFITIFPSFLNFKTRLQLSVLAIIIISFVIIGITTIIYIKSLNNEKNTELLTEKTHSVLIEIEHKLGNMHAITPQLNGEINDMLIKLSNVFFTDINIFDTNGDLIASSREQLFDEGLISRKMNPQAYFELRNTGKTQFVEKENIGKDEYLSAYMPFRNNENKLIAYVNLPYFAKQSELKKEISSFLKAYLNIYVFLIAVAVFMALFISNYITRPLKLIKDKLSNIKLGKKNEKIDWNKNDEIGNLINEYNSMLDQLARSAEMLAKSEREEAWREMAKQVAHEIKNPLTPMKLSIQHLQKAWEDKDPDWEQRLKRFTNTIVEQIDSLSVIASEFSDFTKLPRTDFEKVEITDCIQHALDLYRDNTENKIRFETQWIENCYVLADRKQLIRVFINLIKNAIQAIPATKEGMIKIAVEKQNTNVKVTIADNGVGIETTQTDKIFSPDFTTKTGGSGLGLAIVKSIIENTGGSIRFESEADKGTVFIVELKEYTI
ncbi:MAG: ATP-binding protein [Bacteroidetes bacterium]|nr:ATP-binding protein [Bacteroidota bacterium]